MQSRAKVFLQPVDGYIPPFMINTLRGYLYQSEAIDDISSLRSWISVYNSNGNASGEDSYFGIY